MSGALRFTCSLASASNSQVVQHEDITMSRQDNPFDDIIQPQPRHANRPSVADDPFGDDGVPAASYQGGPAAEAGSSAYAAQSSQGAQSSSKQQGYALDPFFDESVGTCVWFALHD